MPAAKQLSACRDVIRPLLRRHRTPPFVRRDPIILIDTPVHPEFMKASCLTVHLALTVQRRSGPHRGVQPVTPPPAESGAQCCLSHIGLARLAAVPPDHLCPR